jgi:glyoxylase-like metal-dependent hydrolase (beta-lactamase superfamily II)
MTGSPVEASNSRSDSYLHYPFGDPPALGEPMEIDTGLWWLRMPLPLKGLDHINLWLVENDDAWTVIDTGLASDETKSMWARILAKHLNGKPIDRLIVTHMHPDHLGCAGWLHERSGAWLWMSRTDYLLGRALATDTGREAPPEGINFYRAAGFDDAALDNYKRRFGQFGAAMSRIPDSHIRLRHEDLLEIGGRNFRVLIGRGHAPEHVCLYCAELKVLIAGDQILPTISSNVSVWPTEPLANPLREWLDSCRFFREHLPEDTLILPAHGKPFYGAQARLTRLIDSHERDLERVYEICREPRRAVDLFPVLFGQRVKEHNATLAAGESLAHLNYLLNERRLSVSMDKHGVSFYRQARD